MAEEGRRRLAFALGGLWALALLVGAVQYLPLPIFALMPTIMTSFLAPGLILLFILGRAMLREGDDSASARTDRQVLQDTLAQLVLALCIWPAAAVILGGEGPAVIAALGLGFFLARLAFWVGAHRSPALRSFGAAASFLPTVFAALWALWRLASGLG